MSSMLSDGQGGAVVNLAVLETCQASSSWHNILSFKFMQTFRTQPITTRAPRIQPITAQQHSSTDRGSRAGEKRKKVGRGSIDDVVVSTDSMLGDGSMLADDGSMLAKDESSDESTVISSQTSTLTRNQGIPPSLLIFLSQSLSVFLSFFVSLSLSISFSTPLLAVSFFSFLIIFFYLSEFLSNLFIFKLILHVVKVNVRKAIRNEL